MTFDSEKISKIVICFSDYGNVERYFAREGTYQKGVVKDWVSNKDVKEIIKLMI